MIATVATISTSIMLNNYHFFLLVGIISSLLGGLMITIKYCSLHSLIGLATMKKQYGVSSKH